MDEARRGWRALPPPLMLGFGLSALQTVVMTLSSVVVVDWYNPPAWLSLARFGAEATERALFAYGAVQLAQRHTGVARRGLQLAAAAWLAAVLLQFVSLGVSILYEALWTERDNLWITVERHSRFAVAVLPTVGLAIAAMRRHRALAVVSGVITVAAHLPPFAIRAIWDWLALGYHGRSLLSAGLSLLELALIAALAVRLAPVTTMPEPGHAAAGLQRAVVGLRIRMLAVVVGTFPILFAMSSRGGTAFALYKVTLVGSTVVHATAFCWLGRGLLDAAREGGLSRARLAIAGAASLWCGAVVLAQLIFGYGTMYGSADRELHAFVDALVLGVPLVEVIGVATLTAELGAFVARHWHAQEEAARSGAVAGLAARHRDEQLRRDASGQLGWIIVPMLASAVIRGWILPHTTSRGAAEFLTLVAAGCALVALVTVARLCSDALAVLERAPGVPAARVVGAR
jgi:hypothetical protein